MKRKDFYNEITSHYIDKEPNESTYDLKNLSKQSGNLYKQPRKELEIGL